MRVALLAVLSSLPKGWQATALAGRVILYKETKDYRFGATIGPYIPHPDRAKLWRLSV